MEIAERLRRTGRLAGFALADSIEGLHRHYALPPVVLVETDDRITVERFASLSNAAPFLDAPPPGVRRAVLRLDGFASMADLQHARSGAPQPALVVIGRDYTDGRRVDFRYELPYFRHGYQLELGASAIDGVADAELPALKAGIELGEKDNPNGAKLWRTLRALNQGIEGRWEELLADALLAFSRQTPPPIEPTMRWEANATTGRFVVTDENGAEVWSADYDVVATYGGRPPSWHWAWADRRIPPERTARVAALRAFGEQYDIVQLTLPRLVIDEEEARRLFLVALRRLQADAWHRFPDRQGDHDVIVHLALFNVTIAPRRKPRASKKTRR